MDMRSIRYFIAVFEEKSVSAAAKRCFVAQPSISTTIAQLEEKLGVSLFMRHRKGVTPTHEAEKFYKFAVNLLGEFEALETLFKHPNEQAALSIAVMPTIDPGKIGEFIKSINSNSADLLLRLVDLEEESDARIISEFFRKKEERFVVLWEENYVLAMPHGHRLSLQSSVDLELLNGEKLIDRCLCEQHNDVTNFLKKHRVAPIIVARAKSEDLAMALVSAGLGVAIVPETSLRNINNVVARPIKEFKLARKVGFAYNPDVSSSAGLELALEKIKSIKTGGRKSGMNIQDQC
jgi:DNA-binding transcriptional LysR family regulator